MTLAVAVGLVLVGPPHSRRNILIICAFAEHFLNLHRVFWRYVHFCALVREAQKKKKGVCGQLKLQIPGRVLEALLI